MCVTVPDRVGSFCAVAILPPELTEKNLRIFASEVIPKVRHLGVTPATVAAE